VASSTTSAAYRVMAGAGSPFGDGKAAERIVTHCLRLSGDSEQEQEGNGGWGHQNQRSEIQKVETTALIPCPLVLDGFPSAVALLLLF